MSQKEFLASMLEQTADKASQMGIVIYGDFYEPVLQMLIEKEIGRYPNADAVFFGGHDFTERKMLAIAPKAMSLSYRDYPIDCIHIKLPANNELSHRDVLGSLTSLGIAREKIGDINITDKAAQLFIAAPLGDFIIGELSKIGKYTVSAQKAAFEDIIAVEPVFSDIDVIVASMRADVLMHAVFKLSRSEAAAFIKGEKVFVNHSPISKPSVNLKRGDIVSVRSKGRFIVDEAKGTTKKGNIRLSIKKFS